MNREQLKQQIVNNFENAEITEKERLINIMQCIDTHIKQLRIGGVSDTLILTPKDAKVFFNEIMNPKDANEALKKAMLKFITR